MTDQKTQATKVLEAIAKITGNDRFFRFEAGKDTSDAGKITLPASGSIYPPEKYQNMQAFATMLEEAGVVFAVYPEVDSPTHVDRESGLIIDIEESESALVGLLEKVATEKGKEVASLLQGAVGTGKVGTKITAGVIEAVYGAAIEGGISATGLSAATNLENASAAGRG